MWFNPSPYSYSSLGEAAPAAASASRAPWLTEDRAEGIATLTSSVVGAGTQIASLRRRRRRRRRGRSAPPPAAVTSAPPPPPAAPPWPLIIGGALALALIGGYVVLKKGKGKS